MTAYPGESILQITICQILPKYPSNNRTKETVLSLKSFFIAFLKALIMVVNQRIGDIVAEHIRLQEVQNPGPATEEEIINYSNKRVMHTRVVTLAERFADLKKRYGAKRLGKNAIERIIALEYKSYELENKIFSKLYFTLEDLSHLVERASN